MAPFFDVLTFIFSFILLTETFLRLFEQNKTHVMFQWLTDIAKEYSGSQNSQFDPQDEQVRLSENESPSIRKEI